MGVWGTHVELEALGRLMSLSIWLITDRDGALDNSPVALEICNYGSTACCLAYHDGNHYDVIAWPLDELVHQGQVQSDCFRGAILSLPSEGDMVVADLTSTVNYAVEAQSCSHRHLHTFYGQDDYDAA